MVIRSVIILVLLRRGVLFAVLVAELPDTGHLDARELTLLHSYNLFLKGSLEWIFILAFFWVESGLQVVFELFLLAIIQARLAVRALVFIGTLC